MDANRFLSQSCRICSSELEDGVFIFGEDGKKLFLQNKIRKYLYITVALEDKLPKMLCDDCCKKLESIHKFAMMAVKIQDKYKKLVAETNYFNNNQNATTENKGLLHTYLTKGTKVKEEVTEMEVKVDPMLILQCALEDDSSLSSQSSTSSQLNKAQTNHFEDDEKLKSQYMSMWNNLPQTKQVIVVNFNNDWEENSTDMNLSSSNTPSETDFTENITNENELRFSCPICGKIISTKGNLKVHLETHRPKGKYGCDKCGRIFKTQCNLHRHKEYHEGTQFPCAVCGRVYPTNSTLRAHSITHSDLRPHKCPLCIKTFKRNQDLKFHINQHTGARPYQCPYCPKAFASSGNCFSHRKRMHPLEVERDREKAAKIMR